MFTPFKFIPKGTYIKVYFNEENPSSKLEVLPDGLYCWTRKVGMRGKKLLVEFIDEEINDYNDCYFLDFKKVEFRGDYEIKHRPILQNL